MKVRIHPVGAVNSKVTEIFTNLARISFESISEVSKTTMISSSIVRIIIVTVRLITIASMSVGVIMTLRVAFVEVRWIGV